MSSAALKSRKRADGAAKRSRRAGARRRQRDRGRGTGRRRGGGATARSLTSVSSSGVLSSVVNSPEHKKTALSCYDTKRSPIAGQAPAIIMAFGETQASLRSLELILKQAKREDKASAGAVAIGGWWQ